MGWILVLYFTCAAGCGEPVSVTLPQTYATEQGCKEAGNLWLSPDANPHSAGEVENQYPAHCQPPNQTNITKG